MATSDRSRSSRRRPTRIAAAIRLLVLLVAAALVGAACETEREGVADTSGLLVLSGSVGSAELTVRDDGAPEGRPLSVPDPGTSWVSAGRAHVLMAAALGGRTFVSRPVGSDADARWREVVAVGVDDLPVGGPLVFGTWDPAGGAYALLSSDFGDGSGLQVVVIDPALEGASVLDLVGETATASPVAWIDDDRVAVVVGGDAGGATRLVDTTSGNVFDGPTDVALLATSADASTAAVWRGQGPVEVLPTEAWLDGEAGAIRLDPPADAARPSLLALDATGRRLAIVWLEEGGAATAIAVHEAAADWRATATLRPDGPVPSVAWLR